MSYRQGTSRLFCLYLRRQSASGGTFHARNVVALKMSPVITINDIVNLHFRDQISQQTFERAIGDNKKILEKCWTFTAKQRKIDNELSLTCQS